MDELPLVIAVAVCAVVVFDVRVAADDELDALLLWLFIVDSLNFMNVAGVNFGDHQTLRETANLINSDKLGYHLSKKMSPFNLSYLKLTEPSLVLGLT